MVTFVVLRKKEDFDKVFQSHQYKIFIKGFSLFARANSLGYPRLGMVIAKRSIKLAVKRNSIKRRLRENFRLRIFKESIPLDCVVVVKNEAASLKAKEVNAASSFLFTCLLEKRAAGSVS